MKKIILAIVLLGAIGAMAFHAAWSNSSDRSNRPDLPVNPPIAGVKSAPSQVAPPIKAALAAPVPKAPAIVPAKVAAPAPESTAAAQPIAPNPRAELATIIPELARLMETQDFENLMQDFMPRDELNAMLADVGQPGSPMALADLANRMRQDPVTVQKMAGASQFMNYLQTLTPTMDETGQKASYRMPMTVNGKTTVDFIKIDGNWYVQDGRQYFK